MTAFIYDTLAKFGYTHPLHPALVHFPIGLAMAALLFVLTSTWLKKNELAPAPYYAHIFGLITLIPTMFVGYMDWQHYYKGEPNALIIIKIILGFVLMALFIYAIFLGRHYETNTRKFQAVTLLCVLTTLAIGYFGGELQYGG